MFGRRRFAALSGLALSSTILRTPFVRAQPAQRTTRILVGFTAGGALDTVARALAEQIKEYAPTVIVENRPGAGGRLALETLKAAPADGTTIALTPGEQLTLFPHIYKTLNYDPLRDFAPVSTVCTVQFLLTIGPAVPASVDSLDSFIGWCRARPGQANYATPGAGTRHHFFGQQLARSAQFEFVHVPYKGAAAAIQDVLAGQVAALITVTSNALPHIRSGKLRALVTTAPQRSAALPDVRTVSEAGHPSLESVEVFSLLLPHGTPRPVVDALNKAVQQGVATDQFKALGEKLSVEIGASTPEQLSQLIESDYARWPAVVKSAGFEPLD
jgi:tripartite-type tricarboxylate transporter receptor subunit TctC